jgi:hypothetical protein
MYMYIYIYMFICIKAELRDLKEIFESDLKDAEMQAGLAVAEAEEHFEQVAYLIPVHEYICVYIYISMRRLKSISDRLDI